MPGFAPFAKAHRCHAAYNSAAPTSQAGTGLADLAEEPGDVVGVVAVLLGPKPHRLGRRQSLAQVCGDAVEQPPQDAGGLGPQSLR